MENETNKIAENRKVKKLFIDLEFLKASQFFEYYVL